MFPTPMQKFISRVAKKNEKYANSLVLSGRHLENCRFIPSRIELLKRLPKNAVCCELGILFCDFTKHIISETSPETLFLIDNNPTFIGRAKEELQEEAAAHNIHFCIGDSSAELAKIPDEFFDWIYIDANHSFDFVWKDLLQSHRVIKKSTGLIVLNDYIFFDHINSEKYGIVEAVNRFCIDYNYEIVYYALEPQMFCDVVLKRLKPE